MTKDEVLNLALEALEDLGMKHYEITGEVLYKDTFTAIKEALAQPEQKPVATLWQHGETGRTRITMPNDITDCDARWFKAADLYTTPPQRKPLTNKEIGAILDDPNIAEKHQGNWLVLPYSYARAIEAAHGIKGEA